jgi:hypothetical protein
MKDEIAVLVKWTAREDGIVRVVSPEVAAEKLGRTVAVVLARRLNLGLPDFEPRRKSLQGLHNKKPRDG